MTAPEPPGDGRRLLRGLLRDQRRRVVLSAAGGVVHQACEALVPVVIGVLVDRAIAPRDGSTLLVGLAALALLFVLLNSAYRVQALTATRAIQEAEHDLRLRLTRRILAPEGLAPAAGGPPDGRS
ncbi:hypothetical protein ACVU7I_13535, partial [Patulibacter sp. S7RM1-6]